MRGPSLRGHRTRYSPPRARRSCRSTHGWMRKPFEFVSAQMRAYTMVLGGGGGGDDDGGGDGAGGRQPGAGGQGEARRGAAIEGAGRRGRRRRRHSGCRRRGRRQQGSEVTRATTMRTHDYTDAASGGTTPFRRGARPVRLLTRGEQVCQSVSLLPCLVRGGVELSR